MNQSFRTPWFREKDSDSAARSLCATASRIAKANQARRSDDALYMRMYGLRDPSGSGEETADKRDRLRFNLCRSVVETAKNAVGSQQIRPRFVTNDADWSTTRKARACELAVDGEFRRSRFYDDIAPLVFVDGAVASLGAAKVYAQDGAPRIERVMPGEIIVDQREARYGSPRTLYQVTLINADVLARSFPKRKETIEGSLASTADGMNDVFAFLRVGRQIESDDVVVMEAWHLPDREPKDDDDKTHGGRRIVAVNGGMLVDELWTMQRFPFAFYRWSKRQVGFYGMGLVEHVRAYQRFLNYLDAKITDILQKCSTTRLVTWDTSKVNVKHLDNDPTTIVQVAGGSQRPQVVADNAVPTELFQKRRETIEDAYADVGLSRFEAQQEKPAGITAGIALQELHDSQSRRMREPVQAWERFCLDVAELVIATKNHIAIKSKDKERDVQARVRRGTRYHVTSIKWSEVMMDVGDYAIETQPASSLPDTTSGRTQTVLDWFGAGFINQMEAKLLLDVPDLDRFKGIDLAPYEIILDAIDTMIEDGEYVFPEPTDDLELAMKLTTLSYSKYRLRKAPEARLGLLLNYLDDVRALQSRAAQATPQAQAAQSAGAAVSGLQATLPGGASPGQAAQVMQSGLMAA